MQTVWDARPANFTTVQRHVLLCVGLAGVISPGCVTSPTPTTATVIVALLVPTQPVLPASVQDCVASVGATHVHPSWRDFNAETMRVAGPDGFELTLDDVPIGQRVAMRVSDANACLEEPDGSSTRNVFANGTRLTDAVPTPGSGPGLAFTVAADGRVTP